MYTRSSRIAAALGAVAVIGGCATDGGGYGRTEVPAGSVVELHERLDMPGGAARVYLQDGAVVRGGVDDYRVSCSFGLERQGSEELVRAIEPGPFEVVEPSRSWAVAGAPPPDDGVQVAAVSFGIGIGIGFGTFAQQRFGDRASVQRLYYYTELALRSEDQPQVDDLRCTYNGDVVTDHPPTAAEIQQAFGDLATLRSPGGGN